MKKREKKETVFRNLLDSNIVSCFRIRCKEGEILERQHVEDF